MDSASPLALLKLVGPLVPSLSYAALTHSVGLSATSSKWDLRTAMTVTMLRNVMGPPKGRQPSPITKVQAQTLKDPGVKGKMWIVNDNFKASPDDSAADGVANTVIKAVKDTAPGDIVLTSPKQVDITVEWTGYRPNAGKNDVMPDVSEAEKYKLLLAEPTRTSDTTILYFHGGAYYLCDPSTHRTVTTRLAKESGGVVCSVRYRLCPQTAWPGQLIDAFHTYLSLLYPPPGALHAAVPASHIVLGGDSAGGNVSFGLFQLLLHLHRSQNSDPHVTFHGRRVAVPLPAAATASSGWLDLTRNMPSQFRNAKYDFLPVPNHDDAVSRFPSTPGVWPADPPRGDLVADVSLLDHPLLSPVATTAADWRGAPPMWMCTGEEALTDEDAIVARRAARAGVTVQWEQYEAMPHCFGMLLPFLPTADRVMESWGAFAWKSVEAPAELKTNGVYVHCKTGKAVEVDVKELEVIDDDEMARLMQDAKTKRLQGWEKEGKGMPKPSL